MPDHYSRKSHTNAPSKVPKANSGRRLIIIIAITFGLCCVLCCGVPTIAYFMIKSAIYSWMESPATPEPLTPNELVRWNLENKPTQQVVFYNPTQREVELIGVVQEANSDSQLRHPGSTDDFCQLATDLNLEQYYNKWTPPSGKSQLIFKGETANQEVVCWFESADSIEGITPGAQLVVRGRRRLMRTGSSGSYVLELIKCQLKRD